MKDPLYSNKLAAAFLVVMMIIFGIPILAHTFLGDGHHGHDDTHNATKDNPLGLSYPIAFPLPGAANVAEKEPQVDFAALLLVADPVRGQKRAGICASCHSFEKGGANLAGPNLWNVVNRPLGALEGFAYSGALSAFGGAWTYDRLSAYLENSKSFMPGTAMVQRVRKPEHRADIIAYLRSLSDTPAPLPEVSVVVPDDAEMLPVIH